MKRPTLLFRQIGLMLAGVLALNLGASIPARAANEAGAVIDTRLSRPKSAEAYNADWTGAARAVNDSAVITATTSADSGRPSSLLGQAANSACNMAEGFDDIANLPGWTAQNNSSPLGVTNWFQGNADVFSAQAGAANAYIGANYNNGADAATISNWLLTPPVTLQDGATFVFWTRADGYQMYPDRLQVRLSTNGSSVDVGTTATSVGDFSTLLLDINPAYTSSDYPTAWTQYTVTLSGLPTPTTGRLALRYFVENGGPSGTHSNFIGLDTVQFTSPCVSAATTTTLTSTPNPSTFGQAVTFTATVTSTSGSPTGTVQLYDNGVAFGSPLDLSGGQAVTSTSALSIGTHPITATYSGDANFAASTSPTVNHVVNCSSTITVMNNANSGAGSFSQAMSDICDGGTITFNGNYTPTLTSGMITGKNVTLDGLGQTIALVGPDSANNWNLTGSDAGSLGNVAWIHIVDLRGGNSTDAFDLSAFTGTVTLDGNGGTNTVSATRNTDFTLSDSSLLASSAVTATLTNISVAQLTGGAGNNTFTLSGWTHTATFDGAAGNDVLIGDNVATTWNITGTNAGNVNGTVAFTAIENLTGLGGADNFVFAAGAVIGGAIHGGTGIDLLDYSAYTTSVTVNLAVQVATGTIGVYEIENITGGSAGDMLTGDSNANVITVISTQNPTAVGGGSGIDTLVGPNMANTWHLVGANFGDIEGTVTFIFIENLTGGSQDDTFVFNDGASVAGTIDGGAHLNGDTLDYAAYTTGVIVDLVAGTAPGTGHITRIESVVGQDSATGLTSAPNPSTFGQLVTFTATVTSGSDTPTGTVQLYDNGVALGAPITLSGGQAVTSTSALIVGTHPITAAYSGNGTYNSSMSSTLDQVVNASCVPSVTVVNNADSGAGSLRQAIADVCAGGTIDFDPTMSGQTVTLTSGQLSIAKSMTIDGLTTSPGVFVSGNDAVRVFYVSAGTVIINNLTIQNGRNVPTIPGNLGGAGLFIDNPGTVVTLNNCAVINNATNASPTVGGGIVVNPGVSLTMNNCTVSGNSSSFDGGGILNQGTLNINNSTIVNNTTPGGGGGLETIVNTITLRNTILAGNSGPSGADCYTPLGFIQSAGYNLVGSTTNCIFMPDTGDVTGFSYASLLLGPLQNNGGPNSTHALLPGSPAIDAIPGCNGAPATDQRGIARPQNTICDVGAYERQALAATTTSVTSAPNPSTFGQTVTFTATVSPAGATGTVQFYDNGVALESPLTLSGGQAVTSTSALIVGTHPITAAYSGNGTYNSSMSSTLDQVVNVNCASSVTVATNADDGAGSLRQAIADVCAGGTIDFDNDYTIGLEAGQLVIDKSLTIDGTGHDISVDGQSSSRGFYVNAGVTFTLRHVTVTNGSALDGGGLYNNGGTVSLRDLVISQNFASQFGGGVYNAGGYLDIDPTTIISNSAALSGGGLYNDGGTLVISDTAFINNAATGDWPAGNGGGLYSFQGVVTLSQTQFLTNTAYRNGGGAYLGFEGFGRGQSPDAPAADPDTTEIYASLFQGNTVDWGNGGGLFNAGTATTLMSGTIVIGNRTQCGSNCFGGGLYNSGYLTLDGLTIADNQAIGGEGGGYGGGLYTAYGSWLSVSNSVVAGNLVTSSLGTSLGGGLALEGTTQITNTTISGNLADSGGGVYFVGTNVFNQVTLAANTGGGIWTDSQSVSWLDLQNSIIAGNHTGSGDALDCMASLNSLGYNLIETLDGCTLTGDLTGVITGVDPGLGPLQDNGGSTWTMALQPDSPALEAGNSATCAATDQRGVARPQGAVCDMGAFEAQAMFAKAADVIVAQAGQRATYTLSVLAQAPIVNGAISDTLPGDVTLAGPITLTPVGAGTIGTPPFLVTNINLSGGEWLTLTVPITVNAGVTNGARITNTATLTGDGLLPLSASAAFDVDTFDLSTSVKQVNTALAQVGDTLTYTIRLTNTSLSKTGEFTLTDVIPANTTYVPGSLTSTLGSASYAGGVITWTGSLSGTVGASDYVYGDSSGGGDLSGVVYNWIEITPTGTLLELADQFGANSDEGYSPPITLPFPIAFYGTAYDVLTVSANGALYFENSGLGWENTPIPADTTYGINRYIAPFWTDLTLGGGAVYYEVQGTAPQRQVVIEFSQLAAFSSLGAGLTEPATFEVVLYEDRPDILFQYQDVNFNDPGRDFGVDATVGLQASSGQGVQYSYNTPALSDGLAILFTRQAAPVFTADLTFAAATNAPLPGGTWITNTAVVGDSYGDAWMLSAGTLLSNPADVSIAKTVTPTVAQPGQTITYTLVLSNTGDQPASGVVLTDDLPLGLTGVAYQSAGIVITATGGLNQVWQVADLAPGASGIITITGVISPDIQGVAGFTNTATISALTDGNLANNTSSAWVTLLYNLTVVTVGDGTVAPTTSAYLYGTVVPLTATANVGSSFVGWSGDLSGSTTPTSILIDGDKSITATFALNTYTLTVATVGDGTVSPTTSAYLYGAVVPLTATANVGSSFVGWSGDLSGSTNPTSILIDGDKSITATFALNTYTLTVATVGDGTVAPTTSAYLYGTVVPLTATANVGSSFVGWSGDLSGSTNPTSILIDGDKSITATFALNTYTLTVATVGDGTVSPTTSSYLYGTLVPITATANVGSAFISWSGDLSGSTNPTSILIDGDKSITATFALNTYTLTVATVGDGTVSPTTSSYLYGTVVPLTATANVGSSFVGWSGDLSGSTNPTSILIDGDKTITATFALNTYTLTVATVGDGTVAPTTSSYAYGTVVPLTATANVGSEFISWSGDLSGSTNPTSILIDGDKSITATFSANAYTLVVNVVGPGVVSPTTGAYIYGTVVPVTATANDNAVFVGWSGDLSGDTTPTSILIDGDKTITATFEQVEFVTYLPLIAHNAARLPDLIVLSAAASSDVITVVIQNIGDAPAAEAFWVDAYINPTPPPTTVNEIWWDLDRSHEGVAWGVVEPIVPLLPGAVITLTSNGDYVSPDRTYFTGNLPVGTPIYAQVDSYNAATNYGAVLERHEYWHTTYNNIFGPIYSSAGANGAVGRFQPIGPQLNPALPDRPVRP